MTRRAEADARQIISRGSKAVLELQTKESQREAETLFLFLPLMLGIYIHIMERGIKGVR